MAKVPPPAWATVTPDAYDGIVYCVNVDTLFEAALEGVSEECAGPVFLRHTAALLDEWRASSVRGVWLHVKGGSEDRRLHVASWAVRAGLSVHRTSPSEVVCSMWLPRDEPNVLPRGSTHIVGECASCRPRHSAPPECVVSLQLCAAWWCLQTTACW